MSFNDSNELIMSRSLSESPIMNMSKDTVPTFKDILNAQILLHSATDEIATELANRYLKNLTGKSYFNTIFAEVESKYLLTELTDRVSTLQRLLVSLS